MQIGRTRKKQAQKKREGSRRGKRQKEVAREAFTGETIKMKQVGRLRKMQTR